MGKTKRNVLIIIVIFISLVLLSARAFVLINRWYDKHYFQFNAPVTVVLQRPIEIKERVKEVIQITEIINELPSIENLAPIEQYICDKWGAYECKTAIAIARAESGMREEAVGINTNKTIDVGIFQINTVHFKKEGCALKDLVDAYKNVDCAYQIWEDQGWTPWVAYNTGNFTAHYE